MDFGSAPTWFDPENDRCARFSFTTLFGEPQWVSWRMPGGPIREKQVPSHWAGFDTMGWLSLRDSTGGLGIIVKLYPNGPRMVSLYPNVLGLAVSGARTPAPFYRTSASYGVFYYEFVLLPYYGLPENQLENHFELLNNPLLFFYDKQQFKYVDLDAIDKIQRQYTLADFQDILVQ
jgi:hypothetical protein